MLIRAELDYIDRLHHVGRELAVLKRMYQSYLQMIAHVVEVQKSHRWTIGGAAHQVAVNGGMMEMSGLESLNRSSSMGNSAVLPQVASVWEGGAKPGYGPVLTRQALTRFERLRDQIQIYALSEIQDCLDEKESLAFMVSLYPDAAAL